VSPDEEILRRLDRIQATLQLAFAPQLESAREAMREDDVSAAILDATEDWIASTNLQGKVARTTKKQPRAVRDRLPRLVAEGILEARGTERRMEYRRTGLV
jgi:hypothetical protein